MTFAEKPQMKINSLNLQDHAYLINTWSEKSFKGTVVNPAMSYLHGGHLEITKGSFGVLLNYHHLSSEVSSLKKITNLKNWTFENC